MDTYGFLRFIADSWALVALTAVFVGVIFFAYRPGSKRLHDDAAATIFRNDTKPAADDRRGKVEA
ncbi:CcoQ/FixQ family Cbb3-type cytochrome c oxidase assembly chaperone [Gemmobacter aquarius]|uniref:CcoQ/FixQ family Cbb3-type cytochrome c oxidase assembly chaperone n=1 Tax=Paragemmobacter aquarius TaxID=2169400 RepID=A0A2S0UP54_9RHOB|nr:cbb3-type cytochrome c oxidase subunit 3 [Gemmobacter aquarius]AWB49575.1 CcoQ/FixQ family Cbb3-type cytochrome c oxidase assembly chaperone [Gemmobacter aquarius]